MNFEVSLENHFDRDTISSLLNAIEDRERHCLLLNPKKMDKGTFSSNFPKAKPHPFVDNAFFYEKEDYEFGKSILYASGAIYIQDAAAMMVAFLLAAKEGETCIDLCAAPGGKTIGYSFFTKEKGAVVSNDLSMPRAKELSSNIERLGLGNVYVTCSPTKDLAKFYGPSFDNIILDAPCSGSAMFRKNDKAKEDWTIEKVRSCASTQKELLENGYKLLKEGGKLIYSTCSFSYEENEENILSFLSLHEDMEILPLPDSPLFFRPEKLKESIYLLPHLFPGEGQYIALLRKKGNREIPPSHKLPKKENSGDMYRLLNDFGVSSPYITSYKGSLYHLPCPLLFPPSTLRCGVKIKESEKEHIPDHALSHFLSSSNSISLSLEEAKAYLKGETVQAKEKDGIYPVSYMNLNLGFAKVVKGVAKNHYPKGLRKTFLEEIAY
ncbi:MAG: hypothetical protein K6B65_07190 [Bacilli bacterium]|nr:hypothetical protein [Bacilli bacterium]